MTGLSTILPFIRALEPLLADPEITEIMVNAGGKRVFVERFGQLHATDVVLDERYLRVAIKNIARACGDEISESQPILEARLEDGSRVAAMFPPCAVDGPILTLRKFGRRYSLEDLIRARTLTETQGAQLCAAVRERKNILISGGSGTGKTTLLSALAAAIGDDERVVLIEETPELRLEKPNVVRLEATRPAQSVDANSPTQGMQLGELVRTALRHRPDRIIIGEIRSSEAWDLLQALNTGQAGSLTTIHANSATHALTRFCHCAMTARLGLPHELVASSIDSIVGLVVHLERTSGRRRVVELRPA